ncbi:MAG TPA: hypothetical protein VGD01_10610 [Candidatus Elarobacter sp.]
MPLARAAFLCYFIVRLGEAWELGVVTLAETRNLVITLTFILAFLFALAVVIKGVAYLGDRVALLWHVILDMLLVPVSVYLAFVAMSVPAAQPSPVASLSGEARLALMLTAFLTSQALTSLIGLYVLRWIVAVSRRTRS